eukprot:TRINITY_DN29653_c0_g1_i1.p1 TRINITY_DN29653_c0_g1~~TRINITY_DN29653_c0_g1_i1.p1  ORF type:complete len:957 (+),score=536.91 TRINITY_DN29653_c0_g1_i1:68-2938(+)
MSYAMKGGHHMAPEQIASQITSAKELLAIGDERKPNALRKLQDVFSRRRKTWNEKHEEAMLLLIDIAVPMRQNLKDDLINYRSFTRDHQHTFDKVLHHFVEEAEKYAAKAEESKDAKAMEKCDMDDVDDDAAEMVMMKAVSGEEAKDRISREILFPWLRYLSDCYKTCFEICLRVPDHEDTFHKIASKAFDFCRRYRQRISFKNHYCRLMREHWKFMVQLKPEEQVSRIEKVVAEQKEGLQNTKFNLMLKAHLDQLEVAVMFDYWQEAYKTMEDIHGKMVYFRVSPKIDVMLNYYQQLAQIFWVSRNWLFHAYALSKLFLKKEQEIGERKIKDPTALAQREADREKLASKVMLSMICIPQWSQPKVTCVSPFNVDLQREKAVRMATLLGSNRPPTRESLHQDLSANQNILKLAHPKVHELFQILERNVQPLTLAEKFEPLLEWLEEYGLGQFSAHLRLVGAVHVITAASKVYATISLKSLSNMCRFYNETNLESLLVTISRAPSAKVGLCIDHRSQAIRFDDANISTDILSSTLPNLRKRLAGVNRMLLAGTDEGAQQEKRLKMQQTLLLKRVVTHMVEERESIVQRKDIIEGKNRDAKRRLEEQKKEQQLKVEEDKKKQLNDERKKVEEEKQKRLKEEEEEKTKKKQEEKAAMVVKALQQAEITTSTIERRMKTSDAPLDHDELMEQGKKLMIEAKLKAEKKRMDQWHAVHWFERACREFEAPMIAEHHNKKLSTLKDAFEKRRANTLAQLRKDWEEAHANKVRLEKMCDFMSAFYTTVMEHRYRDTLLVRKALKHTEDEMKLEQMMVAADRGAENNRQQSDNRGNFRAAGSAPQQASADYGGGAADWRGGSSASPTDSPKAQMSRVDEKPKFRASGASWRDAQKTEEPAEAPAAAGGYRPPSARVDSTSGSAGGGYRPPSQRVDSTSEAPASEKTSEGKQKWGAGRKGGFSIQM